MSRKYPPLLPNIGKKARLKNIDGKYEYWTIVDEIQESQNEEKVICLQLLEFENKRKELRLGYYIIGKKPRMRGRWVWGQFCTMIPQKIFRMVINKAIKRGWV